MVSLQKYTSHGRTYWRLVESKRINGKPRPIPIMHLGTADNLLKRLTETPSGILQLKTYEHGPVAVLKNICDRLQLAQTIDKHVHRSAHSLSVGTTLELAILNRAIHPTSKRAWSTWANTTSLHRLYPGLEPDQLTSQYFWDQMDLVSTEALEKIETELTRRIVEDQELELNTLFFDVTNFFTYVATTNTRNTIAQRGHNKQKRHDLRQVNLALLVSSDGHFPLTHRTYEGNKADVTEFPESLTKIRKRLEEIQGSVKDVTLVYDRGNNSKPNQELVDESEVGYVAGLTPHHHKDLLDIPTKKYQTVSSKGSANDIPAHRLKKELWGTERTLVLFISQKLREGQIRGLHQHLLKSLTALEEWKSVLSRPNSGPRSKQTAQKKIRELTQAQHLSKVLHVDYDFQKEGADRLSWWVDKEAQKRLEAEVFGKRFLMTNRHDWTTAQIIEAYHGQGYVEGAFRSMKDHRHVSLRPQFHWTDQKVRVQVFICLVALMLARVLEREALQAGLGGTCDALLRELANVRLAMVVRAPGGKGGRPRVEWMLEDVAPETLDLYRLFVLEGG